MIPKGASVVLARVLTKPQSYRRTASPLLQSPLQPPRDNFQLLNRPSRLRPCGRPGQRPHHPLSQISRSPDPTHGTSRPPLLPHPVRHLHDDGRNDSATLGLQVSFLERAAPDSATSDTDEHRVFEGDGGDLATGGGACAGATNDSSGSVGALAKGIGSSGHWK